MSLDRFMDGYVAPPPPKPPKETPKQVRQREILYKKRLRLEIREAKQEAMRRNDEKYREQKIINANPKEKASLESQSIPRLFRHVEYMKSIGKVNVEALRVDIIKNLLVKNNISYTSDKSGLLDEWAKCGGRQLEHLYNVAVAQKNQNDILRIYKIIAARLPY